jgi:hypothetical protein
LKGVGPVAPVAFDAARDEEREPLRCAQAFAGELPGAVRCALQAGGCDDDVQLVPLADVASMTMCSTGCWKAWRARSITS